MSPPHSMVGPGSRPLHRRRRPRCCSGCTGCRTGGAEHWAIESIQIAKDASFLPVIVTDQNYTVHPWLTRPELQDCVVITLSFDDHEHPSTLRSRMRCSRLPISREWCSAPLVFFVPNVAVDQTASARSACYRFAAHCCTSVAATQASLSGSTSSLTSIMSSRHSSFSGLHTCRTSNETATLSPPLTALTVNQIGGFVLASGDAPFTIAVTLAGCRARNAPDVFLGLVHELRKRKLRFRAILHGDGEMREIVDGLLDRFDLADLIEQRFENAPVADTLAESDVLVVTSINEGPHPHHVRSGRGPAFRSFRPTLAHSVRSCRAKHSCHDLHAGSLAEQRRSLSASPRTRSSENASGPVNGQRLPIFLRFPQRTTL